MTRRSPYTRVGTNRLNVFVPAIMSVGMAFWLVALLRDAFRWRSAESLARRSVNAGRSTARMVESTTSPPDPDHIGLRHRPAYLVTALACIAFSVYIFLGSYFNYARENGYVEGLGWLLAAATIVSLGFAFVGVAAGVVYIKWPEPPRWVRSVVAWTPLSRTPFDRSPTGELPSWQTSAAALLFPTASIIAVLLVATEWSAWQWLDEQAVEALELTGELDALRVVDPLGATALAVGLAALVGIATLRCRPLAIVYPVTVGLGFLVTRVTRIMVARDRPPDGNLAGFSDSLPSGHIVQATLIAGLVPLAVAALTGTRRVIWPLRIVLGIGVVAAAVHRVDSGLHWPSDVLVGGLIGLSLVIGAQWVIAHEAWHHWCRGCVWSPDSHGPALLGVIHLHISVQRLVRILAHLASAVAVIALTVLTIVVGVPTDPGEGAGFGPDVQRPVQLALAGVVSIGALISFKWEAAGAVLIAFAATGLGVFAALEYPPATAFALTLLLMIPAMLLWLSWQHRRTVGEIIALAAGTSVLLGATWVGATEVHDFYFGPTHPDSTAATLPVDEVEWVWLGGLGSNEITLTARLDDESEDDVVLVVEPANGGEQQEASPASAAPGPFQRFHLNGLEADTEYTWWIEVDGEADETRGRGSFTTAPDDAGSFRFVFGSCARVDSNGAVFDAMAERDPLFYLNLGDIHYANLESTDPADFRAAYERLLVKPGQAALYRDVPIAHVWDDHDYGPNDSDSSSPGREAARIAYRETVPHYDSVQPGDAPINQAFTIGRVRFVLTDGRSERTDDTMLGAEQVEWLIDELVTASQTHALVVWGNPVPWIVQASEGADSWGGFPDERRQIADALAEAGVENLVMLSGDAHMVALDDGTNSDYSSDQAGGFPVLHAAALDRPGGTKGGPYTDGPVGGGGQYGLVQVEDDGQTIEVTLSGHTWDGEVLVEQTFQFE